MIIFIENLSVNHTIKQLFQLKRRLNCTDLKTVHLHYIILKIYINCNYVYIKFKKLQSGFLYSPVQCLHLDPGLKPSEYLLLPSRLIVSRQKITCIASTQELHHILAFASVQVTRLNVCRQQLSLFPFRPLLRTQVE